jgi:hypothetical protein
MMRLRRNWGYVKYRFRGFEPTAKFIGPLTRRITYATSAASGGVFGIAQKLAIGPGNWVF